MNINSIISQIEKEEQRDADFLHLTANEARMSETARKFLGSRLSERYYLGAGKDGMSIGSPFTALGFAGIAELISEAEKSACEMLNADSVNLNCLSGVHAMMCSILATTEPGDTVMTVRTSDGGHFATVGILERIGRKQIFADFDLENLKFDIDKIAKNFKETNAKAFYMDVSYYLNPHNLKEIRQALGEEAIIIYDASHTMGLIMGGVFQSPLVEGADVISANTHKTLPGPQKGMIAFKNKKLGDKANSIINGSLFSSPHTHHLIALATTILELKEFGHDYARQIVKNSNALAKALVNLGYRIRKSNTGTYSENHQVHLFTEEVGNYQDLYKNLYANNITVNFDKPLGEIFIRLGTQEITRRGMKEAEMAMIAEFLDKSFRGEKIKDQVKNFNSQFNKIKYSFD
ncbi:MAG: DegT/DnrJ/EryC1/StrS family aminotransferase [Candidatus Pacebacteria bacterium]|nr:DegT/DnrJ/EryC1/StrS family aminotransferase [Candidatus Paceibacterota bacterium]